MRLRDRNGVRVERKREIDAIIAREGSISTARIQGLYMISSETARRAVSYIRENDRIYLTNGLIGHLMLRFLPTDIFCTVVVNSADMASELRAFGNFDTYVIDGKMRQSGIIVDSAAIETVSCFKFDLCLLTGGGVSNDFGFSNSTGKNAAFQHAVIKNSKKRVLLMLGNKIGHDSFVKVCDVGEFDEIETDRNADTSALNMISEAGVSVVTVNERK